MHSLPQKLHHLCILYNTQYNINTKQIAVPLYLGMMTRKTSAHVQYRGIFSPNASHLWLFESMDAKPTGTEGLLDN